MSILPEFAKFDPNFKVLAPKTIEVVKVDKISKDVYEILSFL